MSVAAIKTAIVESLVRDGNLFRDNSALKHGIPRQPHVELRAFPPPESQPAPVAQPVPQPLPAPVVQPTAPSFLSGWKNKALATAAVGASVLGGYGASQFFGGDSQPSPPIVIQQPAASPLPSESLLEWLRRNGQNLPPSEMVP